MNKPVFFKRNSIEQVAGRMALLLVLLLVLSLITACQSIVVDQQHQTVNTSTGQSPETLDRLDKTTIINRAQRAMKSGDLAVAKSTLEYTIHHRQWYDSEIFQNLGIIALRQQKYSEAVTLFQSAIIRNPVDQRALNLLAVAYRRMGLYEESESVYSYGLIIAPEYSLFHRNLGILYDLFLQKPELAGSHYQVYLEQQPDDKELVARWMADMKRRY